MTEIYKHRRGKGRKIGGSNELIGLWRRVAGCAVDRPRLPAAEILPFPLVVPIESRKNARNEDKGLTSFIVLENIYRVRRPRDFFKSFRFRCSSPL